MGIIEKIFGTHSEHELKRIYPIVDHIDALEPEMQKLSDEELKEKTKEFKEACKRRDTGRSSSGSVCCCKRGSCPCTWNAPLPCTDDRRYHPASGPYCRDAYR